MSRRAKQSPNPRTDMDVHCSTCGEPWDTHHLQHDAIHETGLTEDEIADWKRLPSHQRLMPPFREAFLTSGFTFGRTLLNVVRCPACPPSSTPDPAIAYFKAELETMLGDDEDALASELEGVRP